MTRFAICLTLITGALALGCSLEAIGPDDDDDDDDATTPPPPPPPAGVDAGPEFLCLTEYDTTGDVTHAVLPGESCDGNGTWTVTLANPVAGEGETACTDAPATITLTLTVAVDGKNASAVDQADPSRTWTGQMADKGGSCAGSFTFVEADGKTAWAIHAVEQGPDGPLGGQSSFEIAR